jgi:hypothetical protein
MHITHRQLEKLFQKQPTFKTRTIQEQTHGASRGSLGDLANILEVEPRGVTDLCHLWFGHSQLIVLGISPAKYVSLFYTTTNHIRLNDIHVKYTM